jgi:hypothetical protein
MEATQTPPVFKHPEDPSFCITGSIFSQPVREGLLQSGFSFSECGALDAPNYLPGAATRATAGSMVGGRRFVCTTHSSAREGLS